MEPHDGPDEPQQGHDDLPGTEPAVAPAAPVAPAPPVPPVPRAAPAAGNESVAAALDELAGVARRPLAEHPDAFGRVHTGLQQALSDIDDA